LEITDVVVSNLNDLIKRDADYSRLFALCVSSPSMFVQPHLRKLSLKFSFEYFFYLFILAFAFQPNCRIMLFSWFLSSRFSHLFFWTKIQVLIFVSVQNIFPLISIVFIFIFPLYETLA